MLQLVRRESRDELHLSLPWHSPRSLSLRARRHDLVAPIGAIVDAGVLSTGRRVFWFCCIVVVVVVVVMVVVVECCLLLVGLLVDL